MMRSWFGKIVTDIPFFDLGPSGKSRRRRLHSALDEVIDAGFYVGGRAVSEFERRFADYLGATECVGVGNGLDGLRIGLEALGIGPGDEVIVPGFTFYASWLAVTQTGATPVPVDVNLETAAIDIEAISAAITSKTRAILVVHLYGIPADLAALRHLADSSGLALIEDAAQSHGAKSGLAMTGSIGDFASFSFYPTKNLGALGDGGAIVTGSSSLASTARSRRSYGQGTSKYEHVDTGWNSRLDSLQAVFLLDGLGQLDQQNRRRREIASTYLDSLGSAADKVIGSASISDSVWHHFVLRTSDRKGVRDYFRELGIGTDIHYPYFFGSVEPMMKYSGFKASLPNSMRLSEEVLSFPISPWLEDGQIARVADAFAGLSSEMISHG
jgi:dTDP-3-amino-3,4,6-trideoxy-alpha-D-glucose transaminase